MTADDRHPAATLPPTRRLKTQQHFRRVYSRGRRAAGRWLTIVVCPRGEGDTGPRVGLSVSKDHGGAVRRNKLKRLFREAFRLEQHRLPQNVDLVMIPRRRDEDFPLDELRAEIVELSHKALAGKPRPRRAEEPRS